MSRPLDLPAALQAWALANYGAGPAWAGTAQRQAPAGSALVPGVSLPAENANYLHGNAFDAAQAAINCAGELPALNWGASVTGVGTGIGCTGLAWSDVEQAWYATQSASTAAFRSGDFGRTWTAVTLNLTGALALAFDTAGNVVAGGPNANTGVQEGPFVAYGTAIVWTTHAAVFPTSLTGVIYDSVHSQWVATGSASAGAAWMYTSTNRAAWTARTIPGTWTGGAAGNSQIGYGAGVCVATYGTAAPRTMRSSDGGITWTNDQALTVNGAITPNRMPSIPVWSATDSLWYLVLGQSGTRKTQVYSSPDGITWTTAATLLANDCNFTNLACLGSLLVALNDDGRVFCSVNKGVNWFRCGITLTQFSNTAQNQWFKAGGNGLLTLGGTNSQASSRFGMPLTAA